jgi:hypothetical protein
MTFQQHKYQVLDNAISYDLANFCFNYFLLKRDAVKYMYENNIIAQNGMSRHLDRSTSTRCLFYICGSRDGNIVNEDVTHYERKNWT